MFILFFTYHCKKNREMVKLQKSIEKRNAILEATLDLINEGGYQMVAMGKVAKLAGVSPATIYLYFENKQDLINQLYLICKEEFSKTAFNNYSEEMSIEEGFKVIWYNIARYKMNGTKEAYFLSQCDNTPMVDNETFQKGLDFIEPMIQLWYRGIEEKKIKSVSPYLIYANTVYPLGFLMNIQKKDTNTFNDSILDDAYKMAWDSIKL